MIDGKRNTDLIPRALIVARYFGEEQKAIENLEADRDAVTRELEELNEEHGGDDGLLAEARTDKGKLTLKSVKDRMKAIKSDDAADERKELQKCLELLEKPKQARN